MTDTAKKRPLLILDLDETLIFGSDVELHRPADFPCWAFSSLPTTLSTPIFASGYQNYDLAIWSSASADYVLGLQMR